MPCPPRCTSCPRFRKALCNQRPRPAASGALPRGRSLLQLATCSRNHWRQGRSSTLNQGLGPQHSRQAAAGGASPGCCRRSKPRPGCWPCSQEPTTCLARGNVSHNLALNPHLASPPPSPQRIVQIALMPEPPGLNHTGSDLSQSGLPLVRPASTPRSHPREPKTPPNPTRTHPGRPAKLKVPNTIRR